MRDPTTPKKERIPCAISGRERPRKDLVSLEDMRPALADRIRKDHPELPPEAMISLAEIARYRTLYVEELLKAEHGDLSEIERKVAESLATHETLAENIEEEYEEERTFGEKLSDHLASFGGSWAFLITFDDGFYSVALGTVTPATPPGRRVSTRSGSARGSTPGPRR